MKIKQFKQGDIITRTRVTETFKDGSYCGDRLEFVGFEKGIIFCIGKLIGNEEIIVRLDEAHGWNDDGWDFYPEKLHQKAVARLKQLAKKLKLREGE